jgi:hypothetical protein
MATTLEQRRWARTYIGADARGGRWMVSDGDEGCRGSPASHAFGRVRMESDLQFVYVRASLAEPVNGLKPKNNRQFTGLG